MSILNKEVQASRFFQSKGGAGGADFFNPIAVKEANVNPLRANSKIAENSTLITPSDPALQPSDGERLSHISVSAYYKADTRGFSPGYEVEDWLAAEAEKK